MLTLSEFFPGTIADAPVGSLVMPRSKYERHGIIASVGGVPYFVVLADENRFVAFPSTDNHNHKGLIIPNVSVEIDETSIGDADGWDEPLGSIVCKDGKIAIQTKKADSFVGGAVLAELAALRPTQIGASFSKWQVTVGSGTEKRVLLSIDAKSK